MEDSLSSMKPDKYVYAPYKERTYVVAYTLIYFETLCVMLLI
jgi:hypothetical protein